MLQTVLGLDIGSYSIKAALFQTTFRSFELTDLFESTPLMADDLAPEDRVVVIREAILRLIQENSLKPSTILTALSGAQASTRMLELPLQVKQLEKVLPFELEPYLPFDLDELIIDHHVSHSTKNQTICLAVAIKKILLSEHLSLLREIGIEPAFVGLDSLSLYNLHRLPFAPPTGCYAVIDMGHQKTSICIVGDQKLQYVRTLYTAGSTITQAIRSELDMTWDQATEVKHQHGILELPSSQLTSADLKRLSIVMKKVLDPVLQEILQTIHASRVQRLNLPGITLPVENIFISGGTSLLRNLPEYMFESLGIPTQRIHLLPHGPTAPEHLENREPVFAQAYALGMRAAARGTQAKANALVNFRKGMYAFARDLSGIRDRAMFFGKWISVIFLLALAHLFFKYELLSRENRMLESIVVKAVQDLAPEEKTTPKKAGPALLFLQQRIKKFQEKQEILTAGLNDLTALGILREVSSRIPDTISVDTQELSIDRNKVTLRAQTDSIASVDQVISKLKEVPSFSRVEKGEIRDAPNGKKGFQATFSIESSATLSKEGSRR